MSRCARWPMATPSFWPTISCRLRVFSRDHEYERLLAGQPLDLYGIHTLAVRPTGTCPARSVVGVAGDCGCGRFCARHAILADPLKRLPNLNRESREQPLYPPPSQAPQLAAELLMYANELGLYVRTLKGQCRNAEAEALRVKGGSAGQMRRNKCPCRQDDRRSPRRSPICPSHPPSSSAKISPCGPHDLLILAARVQGALMQIRRGRLMGRGRRNCPWTPSRSARSPTIAPD